MFALLLALICLFSVEVPAAPLDSLSRRAPELDVYLKAGTSLEKSGLQTNDVLQQMTRELALVMKPAGFRVVVPTGAEFKNNASAHAIPDGQYLVTVELRGSCSVPAKGTKPLRKSVPLAWSSVIDGKVLPFTWIDCDALSRFLAPTLSNQSPATRNAFYGRAMARLLAHEFYHVLTQNEDHANAGVAKARLRAADLLADRCEFDQQALNKFHSFEVAQLRGNPPNQPPDAPVPAISDSVAVGGR